MLNIKSVLYINGVWKTAELLSMLLTFFISTVQIVSCSHRHYFLAVWRHVWVNFTTLGIRSRQNSMLFSFVSIIIITCGVMHVCVFVCVCMCVCIIVCKICKKDVPFHFIQAIINVRYLQKQQYV